MRPITQASQILSPALNSTAVVIDDRDIIEPREKSIPPDISTKVMPIVIIPSEESPIAVEKIFFSVKKWGETIAKKVELTIIDIITVPSLTFFNFKTSRKKRFSKISTLDLGDFVEFMMCSSLN
jgi:hypothetical protein